MVAVGRAESALQAKMDAQCATLSDTSLKMLRRKLPITRQPFDFASSTHGLRGQWPCEPLRSDGPPAATED